MGGMSAMFRPGGDYYAFEELDPSILKLLKEMDKGVRLPRSH